MMYSEWQYLTVRGLGRRKTVLLLRHMARGVVEGGGWVQDGREHLPRQQMALARDDPGAGAEHQGQGARLPRARLRGDQGVPGRGRDPPTCCCYGNS